MLTKEMDLRYKNGERPDEVYFLQTCTSANYKIISVHKGIAHSHREDGILSSTYAKGFELVEYDARSEIKKGQVIAVRNSSGHEWELRWFKSICNSYSVDAVDQNGPARRWPEWRFLTPEELGQ
jgi:hypothetical protein